MVAASCYSQVNFAGVGITVSNMETSISAVGRDISPSWEFAGIIRRGGWGLKGAYVKKRGGGGEKKRCPPGTENVFGDVAGENVANRGSEW